MLVSLLGTSALPSPAGAAAVPEAPPVASGHVGFVASAFAPVKYAGNSGAASGAFASAAAAFWPFSSAPRTALPGNNRNTIRQFRK